MLVLGFGLGALSVVLRRRKVLGFTGIALATAARCSAARPPKSVRSAARPRSGSTGSC